MGKRKYRAGKQRQLLAIAHEYYQGASGIINEARRAARRLEPSAHQPSISKLTSEGISREREPQVPLFEPPRRLGPPLVVVHNPCADYYSQPVFQLPNPADLHDQRIREIQLEILGIPISRPAASFKKPPTPPSQAEKKHQPIAGPANESTKQKNSEAGLENTAS